MTRFLFQDSNPSLDLVVGREGFPQMGSYRQSKLLECMLFLKLWFKLEAMLPVKTIQRDKGQRSFSLQPLKPGSPELQHCGAGFSGDTRWSPENLRSQNLKATVVKDPILHRERVHASNQQVFQISKQKGIRLSNSHL